MTCALVSPKVKRNQVSEINKPYCSGSTKTSSEINKLIPSSRYTFAQDPPKLQNTNTVRFLVLLCHFNATKAIQICRVLHDYEIIMRNPPKKKGED